MRKNFILLGASGVGKSSLINALVGKTIAEIGDIKPVNCNFNSYSIKNNYFRIIDTRGLFEITSSSNCKEFDEQEFIDNLTKFKPSLLVHVSTPSYIRTGHDMDFIKRISEELQVPKLLLINKIDLLSPIFDWPPSQQKLDNIDKFLNWIAFDILELDKSNIIPISKAEPRGYVIKNHQETSNYLGIIPVSSLQNHTWNIENLKKLLLALAQTL